LDSLSEANLVVLEIKGGIISGDEHISKDISRTNGKIKSNKAAEALSLACRSDLDNIILRSEVERNSVDDDLNVGELANDIAVGEDTLAIYNLGSELDVKSINVESRSDDQRGSGVSNSNTALGAPAERSSSEFEVIDGELPVSLRGDGSIREVSSVARGIGSSEGQFSSDGITGILAQPEGEDLLIDKILGDNVVPDWSNGIDRNGLITKSEKTIEFGEDPAETRFMGYLSEGLMGDLEASNVDGILAQKNQKLLRFHIEWRRQFH